MTVHDGPSLAPGEIIAPAVGSDVGDKHYHNNFQDPQRFLDGGGRRGRQYQPLTDGTYFINRWFATVEQIPKTVVPIGYVGVVVSYYGQAGDDLSGIAFRHGERVAEGQRGVWERPFGPGKYAFNTYAGQIVLVPTTNFVLHWVTGRSETHRYDDSLRSIDLVTRDAYEPRLPLSVVVHIDYQRAPNVIQRFGDVKKLITQTLDPLLSAYFRDIAHKKTMLELLHDRDLIQAEARAELRRKFREFDIECVDVLIGKPDTDEKGGKIEVLLEQLRQRQLSIEQLETYERQREASDKRRELAEAQAQADMQTSLTNARVKAQIAESEGEADLQRARKQADKQIVMAEANLAQSRRQAEQTLVLAEADSQQADPRRPRRGPAHHASRPLRSRRPDAKGRQLRRSAAVRPVARRQPARQEHAAAGARAGVLVGRRRTGRKRSDGKWQRRTPIAAPPPRSPPPASSACCCKRSSPSGRALPAANRRAGLAQGADRPPDARDAGQHAPWGRRLACHYDGYCQGSGHRELTP